MFLKRLFYVSASILLLAAAYHLGASTARAQAPGNPVVAAFNAGVITANGDVYTVPANATALSVWVRAGNVFTGGGPTPSQTQTFGALKARYR